MSLFNRRRPSDLMSDPRMDDLREKALNRTSEDSMRAYGGGTGTSGVPVGTVMVEAPGVATRAMSGVGTGSNVRMIGSEVVQPSDPSWTGEKVQTLMGEVSPEGRGRAAAVRAGSVAERLLGPTSGNPPPISANSRELAVGSSPLFYDENHFQTSANKDKRFNNLQSDYWLRNRFEPWRAANTSFANLDDYDQKFRSIQDGKPGEFGDAMKQAYLDGMPPAIRDEFVERKMQEGVNRREGQAVAPFNATSGLPPVQNKDQLEAAKAGQDVAGKTQQMAIQREENLRSERQLKAYEQQVAQQAENGEISREEKTLRTKNITLAQEELAAAVKTAGSIEKVQPIISSDGKFYYTPGDRDPVTGIPEWKVVNPWSIQEQLGARMAAGKSPAGSAAPGPDVTGGGATTKDQFVASFKAEKGREPTSSEIERAKGRYWR